MKDSVSLGFVDDDRILSIFERSAPSSEMKALETAEWIQTLDEIFSRNTIKIEFDQERTFQNIKAMLESE